MDKSTALRIIDQLFRRFPEKECFNLGKLIESSDISEAEKVLASVIGEPIETLLINTYQYAEYCDNAQTQLRLTSLGREVKKAGGHFVFLSLEEEKEVASNERQKLSDEKLIHEVKYARFISKTYIWTFIMAILSLALTLAQIILSMVNHDSK